MAKVRVVVEKYVKVTVDVDVPEAAEVIETITDAVESAFEGEEKSE